MAKSIFFVLLFIQGSVALSQSLPQKDEATIELCGSLYPDVLLQTCIKETKYPTFSLISDHLEMAKRHIQNGESRQALVFVEKAQQLLGVRSPEKRN
mgnify:CR=1 FL=1